MDEQVDLIINTPAGSSGARHDGYEIRAAALNAEIPCITTVQAAVAAVQAIESIHGISETASKGEESAGQGHPQPGQDGAEEDDRRPNASLMVAAIQDLHA